MAVHAPVSQGKLSSSLLPAKHLKHSLKALATLSFSCLWQMPWKHFDFTYYTFVDLLNVSVKELKRKRRDMAHVHKALIFDINNWSESVARRCAHMSSLRSHFRRTLSHPAKKKKQKKHQHSPTSCFCLQWEKVQSVFITSSNDSAVVMNIYQVQLWSAVMETRHPGLFEALMHK